MDAAFAWISTCNGSVSSLLDLLRIYAFDITADHTRCSAEGLNNDSPLPHQRLRYWPLYHLDHSYCWRLAKPNIYNVLLLTFGDAHVFGLIYR